MLDHDVLELILKRLSVTDLIRCKSVCKFWKDLISDSRFIKIHMNHSYHVDCINYGIDRRIVMGRTPYLYGTRHHEFDDCFFDYRDCHLLGSSNGLVCISPLRTQILVVNPSTREVKRLKDPRIVDVWAVCWGFGYDSFSDDYKVILGYTKGDGSTCFQVLTLKSNDWKLLGDVNYSIVSRIGILCNGALHWVMKDASSQNNKNAILSFDLSDEEIREIHQPDDAVYEYCIARHSTMRLGVLEERLCAFNYDNVRDDLWMMTNYNVKESWGMIQKDWETKVFVHRFKELKHYIHYKRSLFRDIWFSRTLEFVGCPMYVMSLVSPHVNGTPKRRHTSNNTKRSKLNNGDPSVPGPSGKVIGRPMRSSSTDRRHTPVFSSQGFLGEWCRVQSMSKAVKPFMGNWVAEDAVVISSVRDRTQVRWVL
ncbi:hypothetical protein LXL04_004131 [Taraxacum kok-saghyz]